MTTTPNHFSFNGWYEPWIHVIANDGNQHTLSIKSVLTAAHTLQVLADSSPLIVGGTHRLLTAILQFIYSPNEVADISDILTQKHFDPVILADFERTYAHRFDLFDSTEPFLQTGDVAIDAWIKGNSSKTNQKSLSKITYPTVAKLFTDIPTVTNRTHFQHVTDSSHSVCPACCLAGLVTFSAFAQNGGSGWRASINGDPPLYLTPIGENLFEGLTLSLMSAEYQPKNASYARRNVAPWTRDAVILKGSACLEIGYIESLTFPAWRVRLFPQTDGGVCTRCGVESAIRIVKMLWEPGLYRNKEAELWHNPFVAYYVGSDKKLKSLKVTKGKTLWREYSTLFLSDNQQLPSLIRQIGQLVNDYDLATVTMLRFRCIGLKTDGKAKVSEWTDEALEVPPMLLKSPGGASVVREALNQANQCERILSMIFSLHIRDRKSSTKKKHDLLKAIQTRMQDTFWATLSSPFRDLVREVVSREVLVELRSQWETTVINTGERVLDEALNQRGDSAALLQSRTEALNHYRGIMGKYRKEGWHVKSSQ